MNEQKSIQYDMVKSWQIVLWPLNSTVNAIFGVLMMFNSYIAAGGYGVAVAAAGLIATYSRIFDGITDPLFALFSDRLITKYGKVRILMVFGFVIQALSAIAMFFWGIGNGVVLYTLIYSIFIIGSTISSIAANTGNACITNNPVQRNKVFRWYASYTTLIATFTSVYLSKVLFAKYGKISVEALQELCITVVLVGLVLEVLALIAIGSRDKAETFLKSKTDKSVGFRDIWNLLRHNRAMQMYIAAVSSDKLASQAASQSAVTVMVFGIVIGNYSFSGTLGLINLAPTLLAIFFATKLAGKNGTKKAVVQWTSLSLILGVLLIVYMLFVGDPSKISVAAVPTVIFVGLNALLRAASMATTACNDAMRPDVVDYEMYRTGKYIPGTVGATFAFLDKIISSFGATIVGLSVSAIGYVAAQPQPKDPRTPAVFWLSMFLWMGMPVLGWACTLIAMKWYPLDREKMVEIQIKNREAREAAKLANAANP